MLVRYFLRGCQTPEGKNAASWISVALIRTKFSLVIMKEGPGVRQVWALGPDTSCSCEQWTLNVGIVIVRNKDVFV